jgi:excisionase family DNA binding protein
VVTKEEQPRTISIEAAAKELGIGRSLAYQLARSGELPGVIKLGNRYVISRAALDRLLDGGLGAPMG